MAIKHTTVGRNSPYFSSLLFPTRTPVIVAGEDNVTYTAEQILGGVIVRDIEGAEEVNDVTPTAAELIAAIAGAAVGTSFECVWVNGNSGANPAAAPTVQLGTGITGLPEGLFWSDGAPLGTYGDTAHIVFMITNVDPGAEAISVIAIA
jgi:hypothetical protein